MKLVKLPAERGILALIALTAMFAMLSVLARLLGGGFTVTQQVYLRVFVALLLALVVFRRQLRWHKLRALPLREWLLVAFRAFVTYGIGVTFISKAANTTLIGHVSFIAALPFVPLLGFLVLKEKVTWWKVMFVVGSLLGVSLMAVNNPHDLLSWNKGDLMAIIATLGFAVGYISRRWQSDALNNHEITTLMFVFGCGFVLLLSLVLGNGVPSFDHSWTLWLTVVAGGALNVANIFLVNYAFQHVDAVRAGNLLNLESAWGLLFGLVFFGEWPSWRGLLGGVMIVACVAGMNLYAHRDAAKLAPVEDEAA